MDNLYYVLGAGILAMLFAFWKTSKMSNYYTNCYPANPHNNERWGYFVPVIKNKIYQSILKTFYLYFIVNQIDI